MKPKQPKRRRVLFLCTGNSARSQMAEAILRSLAGDRFEVHSAGLEPRPIHANTIEVMKEVGLDLAGQAPTDLKTYLAKVHFDFVITVCTRAEKSCPRIWLGAPKLLHWAFEDPAAWEGSDEDMFARFRAVRDQIDETIRSWLETVDAAAERAGQVKDAAAPPRNR